MAVAYDNASTGENAGSGVTFSHTTGAGSDRGLVVWVHTFFAGGGPIPSSVTYAAVAMAQVATTLYGTVNNERITAYRLEAPVSGANNVVVNVTGSDETVSVAMSVTGCDQTNMLSDSDTFSTDGVTTATITLSSATGEMCADGVAWFNQAATVGSGQAERINNDNGSGVNSIAASTEAGAASVVMSWTWGAAENPGHIAVAIREPVPPPSGTPGQFDRELIALNWF